MASNEVMEQAEVEEDIASKLSKLGNVRQFLNETYHSLYSYPTYRNYLLALRKYLPLPTLDCPWRNCKRKLVEQKVKELYKKVYVTAAALFLCSGKDGTFGCNSYLTYGIALRKRLAKATLGSSGAVSYTHLTLPTIYSV